MPLPTSRLRWCHDGEILTVIGVICGLACLGGGVAILIRSATHQPPKKTALDIAEEHERGECPCSKRDVLG